MMIATIRSRNWPSVMIKNSTAFYWLCALITGALLPLGFAPFHLPGAAILGLAIFYAQIQHTTLKKAFFIGFAFGLGFFGFGVSWVYVSIHLYGHLNILVSIGITAVLIAYLSLFPGCCALSFRYLSPGLSPLLKNLVFASLWCIFEYLRATCCSGFPWLLLGVGQIDTPLANLMPIIGVYGISFMAVFAATLLTRATQKSGFHLGWLLAFLILMIAPASLKSLTWTTISPKPISVGVIQANLSMRDKWDETLFWKILSHYQQGIDKLIGTKQLIILPESAIPLPAVYIQDVLIKMNKIAKKAGSTIILGIPEETTPNQANYYNTLTALGQGFGTYRKQQLVPFGEYIPEFVANIMQKMDLPLANMVPGALNQPLVTAQHQPFASLICYELAYPKILRQQLPVAQWIVSISDDGWFGHSFAMYQQLQMAQALSILSGRYQIMANNDGLTSVITHQGILRQSLASFTSGILEDVIYPAQGSTPWVIWGDSPMLGLCGFIILLAILCLRRRT